MKTVYVVSTNDGLVIGVCSTEKSARTAINAAKVVYPSDSFTYKEHKIDMIWLDVEE